MITNKYRITIFISKRPQTGVYQPKITVIDKKTYEINHTFFYLPLNKRHCKLSQYLLKDIYNLTGHSGSRPFNTS